jgi:hypothetical protein
MGGPQKKYSLTQGHVVPDANLRAPRIEATSAIDEDSVPDRYRSVPEPNAAMDVHALSDFDAENSQQLRPEPVRNKS